MPALDRLPADDASGMHDELRLRALLPRWRAGALPSESKPARAWRTRSDPFVDVWDSDVVPLLDTDEEGVLEATTIFSLLEERHPGRFQDGQLFSGGLTPTHRIDPGWVDFGHGRRLPVPRVVGPGGATPPRPDTYTRGRPRAPGPAGSGR